MLLTSCQSIPLQLHPLAGEGEPPGYIDGRIPDQYKGMRNPFTPSDPQAVAEGLLLYHSYEPSCATCHGDAGRGDGPMHPYLEPQPADYGAPPLLSALRDHQDYVFWWVSEGVDKTVMPPWVGRMTETERWQVITYAWSLGEEAAKRPTARAGRGSSAPPARPPFLPAARSTPVVP